MKLTSRNSDVYDYEMTIQDPLNDSFTSIHEEKILKMGPLQKLKLKVFGKIYIGKKQLPGWKAPLPFYIFKCPTHGLQMSYPNGWNRLLICPKCIS